jgi:hypothetical protein
MSDFREAVLQVIQEFKPIRDYKKLNPYQLLYHLARLRALGRDTLARVILVGRPDVDVDDLKRVAEETADISDNLGAYSDPNRHPFRWQNGTGSD